VYLLCINEAFSDTVSFSVLYIYTDPETFVNDELSPPVMSMHPSFKPIATEYDYKAKF
jgi:hypothetical protein